RAAPAHRPAAARRRHAAVRRRRVCAARPGADRAERDGHAPVVSRQALAGASSNEPLGRTRASGLGRYQFHLPSSSIVAGTRRRRTIVASTRTATALPSPSWRIDGTPVPTKTRNTLAMISAAEVMVLALEA